MRRETGTWFATSRVIGETRVADHVHQTTLKSVKLQLVSGTVKPHINTRINEPIRATVNDPTRSVNCSAIVGRRDVGKRLISR